MGELLRTRHGAFTQAPIADRIAATAMFGNLFGMDGEGDIQPDPDPVYPIGHVMLLRQFVERPLAPGHNLPRSSHLRIEIRIGSGQFDTTRSDDHTQRFPYARTKMRQQFLGQDHPGAVPHFGDFERYVHTDERRKGPSTTGCRRARFGAYAAGPFKPGFR